MDRPDATASPSRRQLARVAFTGKLASMSRREATAIVTGLGGSVASTVSRRTSLLVVGMDGWPLLPDGAVSRKLHRAEQLRRSRVPIDVVSEAEFLEITGRSARREQLRKSYPAEGLAELAGIDTGTLRRWELLGLVRASAGLYDFQDIVSLRCIAQLVRNGVPPATIGRSVRALAAVMPGTDRPLAQLKIVAGDEGTVLAELGEALVDPGGQLRLNFERSDEPDEGPALRAIPVDTAPAGDADAWLERGRALEDAEQFEEAVEAYRRAQALAPQLPEAQFNLANALRSLGRVEAAEERYRAALELDPAMVEAWYNLADVQEEAGRLEEAVSSLEEAVRACPTYADAHFNLAACCEELGRRDDACVHWRAYLRLDAAGEWAEHARARLLVLSGPTQPAPRGPWPVIGR